MTSGKKSFNWRVGIWPGIAMGMALGVALDNFILGTSMAVCLGIALSHALATNEKAEGEDE